MAKKIFIVIAILVFILTLSSCQKGVTQQEYDVLKAQLVTASSELSSSQAQSKAQLDTASSELSSSKAQLDTASSELSSLKESAKQTETDLSDLKSKLASAKQYADILSLIFSMTGSDSTNQAAAVIAITTMVDDTGNQELIDEWSKVINNKQSDQTMNNVFQMVLKGIVENTTV